LKLHLAVCIVTCIYIVCIYICIYIYVYISVNITSAYMYRQAPPQQAGSARARRSKPPSLLARVEAGELVHVCKCRKNLCFWASARGPRGRGAERRAGGGLAAETGRAGGRRARARVNLCAFYSHRLIGTPTAFL